MRCLVPRPIGALLSSKVDLSFTGFAFAAVELIADESIKLSSAKKQLRMNRNLRLLIEGDRNWNPGGNWNAIRVGAVIYTRYFPQRIMATVMFGPWMELIGSADRISGLTWNKCFVVVTIRRSRQSQSHSLPKQLEIAHACVVFHRK